ncbi:MAG: hypothetical protein ACK2UB_04775 [Anaerolineales bacterium]
MAYNAAPMREWNLTSGDPLSLFLAADARFGMPDYTDDQIWELFLRGGDPPAMAAETMLGLRAVCLRIFPIFVVGGRTLHDPASFAGGPVVRRFAPNYAEIRCRPVPEIESVCEYWVPESHALAGRITLRAVDDKTMEGECWMGGILRPAAEGSPFAPESAGPYEGIFLRGRVRGADPVLMVAGAGGIGRGAIPSLKTAFEIGPDRPHVIRWAFCCLSSSVEGLRAGRSVLAREWEAEIARVELEAESIPDIRTGRADWDAVLAFSQQTALQSLIGATRSLPHPSPVIGRNPERGYSLRGDGSDYPPAWRGAGLHDLMMILPVWALARPETAKGLVRNYLAAAGDGLPDGRPGAGKQRSGLLAPPLLAQAAWRALAGREDIPFLEEIWPLIDRTLEAWFSPEHDRDRDGAPEWERADSFGPGIPPMFAREDPWGGWIRPEEAERPSLAALLHGECFAAARMARRIGRDERAEYWLKQGDAVRRSLERMEGRDGYRTVDRETHASPSGRQLWAGRPGDAIKTPIQIEEASRLLVRCMGGAETRPLIRIRLKGTDARGAECEEAFASGDFSWLRGEGIGFSRTVWTRVESIRAEGPPKGMTFHLEIPGLAREDLSHFLPLWSRSVPRGKAGRLFSRLMAGTAFDSPSGLRFVPEGDEAAGKDASGGVWMFWNMLMGEAAIRYGREDLALEWIEKWIRTLAESLRTDGSFRMVYDPLRPGGSGPRNALQGAFPPGLFLAALGVHPVAADRVWAGGHSIFPFPVTVRYKGMILEREGDSLRVKFPSGRTRDFRGKERTLLMDPAE